MLLKLLKNFNGKLPTSHVWLVVKGSESVKWEFFNTDYERYAMTVQQNYNASQSLKAFDLWRFYILICLMGKTSELTGTIFKRHERWYQIPKLAVVDV
jgi:hypothetical protein